ncbi:hypothetical protein Droror1_Dr00013877 [Drosera rotundifolia]
MEEKNKKVEEVMKGEVDHEKWVCDSSTDSKGRVPLRASTGVWKASLFIIAIEFSERLSYFGLATSLIIYLTRVVHQDLDTAAKSVNYWTGVTTSMPLFGGFLADAYLGRFSTVLLSSIIYLLGLMLLLMSRTVQGLRPCAAEMCQEPRKIHEAVFFLAIYMISIGTGGHKPALESFGADQFDDDHAEERIKKMSFFNWWNFGLCCGLFLAVTVIVYVQEHAGWGAADIILIGVMSCSLMIFLIGRPFYRYRKPTGSPLTPMLQVLIAAIRNRNLPLPSDSAELYEAPVFGKSQGRLLCHTDKLKFLDKAAVIADEGIPVEEQSPWKLATITKVEETKLMVNMIPIWLSCLVFGVTVAQTTTFFIKQGTVMDRRITDNFSLPPPSIFAISAVGMIFSVIIYDRILVPMLRKVTGNARGMSILQRIGIGMVFGIAAMVTAALVERKRLRMVQRHKTSLHMSVFWLAPQFFIIGFGDGFTLVGLQEYFYDQVPDSMRSLGIGLYLSVIGAGNFLSSFLISIIDNATEKNSGKPWVGKELNSSRLDYFYWLLAVLVTGNLCVYVFLARRYSYKSVKPRTSGAVIDYESKG